MSCERYHTAAYSSDIRWRIVHQVIGLEKTYRDVAINLNVDPSTVQRTVDRFMQMGDVQKRSYPPKLWKYKAHRHYKSIFNLGLGD